MNSSSRLNWGLYDDRAKSLETSLQQLLRSETYSKDDRRLARMYLAFAELARPMMPLELIRVLDLVTSWRNTGEYPAELENVPQQLGLKSSTLLAEDNERGQKTERPFLYRLMQSCTRPRFTIDPESDVDPIAWMAAIGTPIEEIERAVYREYPTLKQAIAPRGG